jgi:hypothetical protein
MTTLQVLTIKACDALNPLVTTVSATPDDFGVYMPFNATLATKLGTWKSAFEADLNLPSPLSGTTKATTEPCKLECALTKLDTIETAQGGYQKSGIDSCLQCMKVDQGLKAAKREVLWGCSTCMDMIAPVSYYLQIKKWKADFITAQGKLVPAGATTDAAVKAHLLDQLNAQAALTKPDSLLDYKVPTATEIAAMFTNSASTIAANVEVVFPTGSTTTEEKQIVTARRWFGVGVETNATAATTAAAMLPAWLPVPSTVTCLHTNRRQALCLSTQKDGTTAAVDKTFQLQANILGTPTPEPAASASTNWGLIGGVVGGIAGFLILVVVWWKWKAIKDMWAGKTSHNADVYDAMPKEAAPYQASLYADPSLPY